MKNNIKNPILLLSVVSLGFASLELAAAQNSAPQPPNTAIPQKTEDKLSKIDRLIAKGNYSEAETVAKLNLSQANASGGPLRAHIALGKVELVESKFDSAFADVSWHWKPGKNSTQDLLAAMAGIQVSDHTAWHDLARTALMDYVMEHCQQIGDEFGSASYNLGSTDPAYVAGTAALLYAADESDSPGVRLKFAQMADTLIPGRTDISYVKGILEGQLHQDAEAKVDLEFVHHDDSPFLAQRAANALASLKSLPK